MPGGTLSGPNMYNIGVTNVAAMAAVPANPSRLGLTIQNNSAATVTFTFGTITPVSASVGQQIAANANTTIPPNAALGLAGNLGAQLNLISSSAGPNNVTVLEYV